MQAKTLLPALVLVLAMLALAQAMGRQEVIFPEIAALAFGAWVMERMPWRGRALLLWLSPTLAAVTGIVLQQYLPHHPFLAVLLAFAAVAVELRLCRSGILPAVSAAILPIITRVDSWWYPASVCLLTGAIALGRTRLSAGAPRSAPGETGPDWRRWLKLGVIIAAASALALASDWLFLIAPPLFVLAIELSDPHHPARAHPVKTLIVVSAAAAIGSGCLALGALIPGCPLLVPAGLALALVLALERRLDLFSPPTIALALVPTIVPPAYAPWYPLHVALGCACFVVAACLLFPAEAVRGEG